jgi:peroxiredoxin
MILFQRIGLISLVVFGLGGCGPEAVRTFDREGRILADGTTQSHQQIGQWTYYYADGTRKALGTWVADKQEGPWQWWYPDGSPQFAGSYADHGLRTGVWRSWHPGGSRASEGAYREDRQVGVWTYWHPQQGISASGTFAAGVKHGYWLTRNVDGTPASAGLYVQGLKVGPWVTWNGGVATVADLGVPLGHTAGWEGTTWVMRGPTQVWLEFASDGHPVRLATQVQDAPGGENLPLPADLNGVVADLAPLRPPAEVTRPIPPGPTVVAMTPSRESPVLAVVAASSNQVETPTPGLSPTPLNPTGLTTGDLAKAEFLIKTYTVGKDQSNSDYDWGSTTSQGDPSGRKLIGKPLAQTRFLSSTGSVIDLTRFAKPVVVVVMRGFSGQVCIYCASQTAAIANAYQRFTAAGADVVVVYPGPTEAVPAFIQAVQSLRQKPAPMPIGLDVSLLLVRSLGIEANLAKPTSLILDRNGIVRYAYVGANMADRPSVEDLLKALAQDQK